MCVRLNCLRTGCGHTHTRAGLFVTLVKIKNGLAVLGLKVGFTLLWSICTLNDAFQVSERFSLLRSL